MPPTYDPNASYVFWQDDESTVSQLVVQPSYGGTGRTYVIESDRQESDSRALSEALVHFRASELFKLEDPIFVIPSTEVIELFSLCHESLVENSLPPYFSSYQMSQGGPGDTGSQEHFDIFLRKHKEVMRKADSKWLQKVDPERYDTEMKKLGKDIITA